jgi:hypothetical protein
MIWRFRHQYSKGRKTQSFFFFGTEFHGEAAQPIYSKALSEQ